MTTFEYAVKFDRGLSLNVQAIDTTEARQIARRVHRGLKVRRVELLEARPAMPSEAERREFKDAAPAGRCILGLSDVGPMLAAQRTEAALATNEPRAHYLAAQMHATCAAKARWAAGQKAFGADVRAWSKRRARFHLRMSEYHGFHAGRFGLHG